MKMRMEAGGSDWVDRYKLDAAFGTRAQAD
jgi:hypothetical protein